MDIGEVDYSQSAMQSHLDSPSRTTVTLVGQWATSLRIALRERASRAKASTRVKVRASTRAPTMARARLFDKGNGKGSGPSQGYGYRGRCHHCGEVGHKGAECWKYWKDHQNQIRAVDEQEEEEASEQVECQTCWMVGQVDEGIPPPLLPRGFLVQAKEGGTSL